MKFKEKFVYEIKRKTYLYKTFPGQPGYKMH